MDNFTIADTPNESVALVLSSPYGYMPTTSISILFVVLYTITALLHLAQAAFLRVWWMLPTVMLCGLYEIIGWAARLWSSNNMQDINPFLIQYVIYWSRMQTWFTHSRTGSRPLLLHLRSSLRPLSISLLSQLCV